MPKRDDIKSILIIGAGPIIIGQACEFDYSGTQAARALKEEGYKIILVNSNPATIMTDPEIADRTYIEPITVDYVSKIISKENPDAILPTVGGQTALNLAIELSDKGILKKYNVELIGAQIDAIQKAEDREKFKDAMDQVSIETAQGNFIYKWEEAKRLINNISFPVIIRPSFTLGGTGGSVAYNFDEFQNLIEKGLIEHEDETKFINLTDDGHNIDHEILTSRTLLFYFFKDFLGVDEKMAKQDACLMEYLMAEQTSDKLFEFMKNLSSESPSFDIKTDLDLSKYQDAKSFKDDRKGEDLS